MKKKSELDRLIEQAIVGYQINIMHLSMVRSAARLAQLGKRDVVADVRALLDRIAIKTL